MLICVQIQSGISCHFLLINLIVFCVWYLTKINSRHENYAHCICSVLRRVLSKKCCKEKIHIHFFSSREFGENSMRLFFSRHEKTGEDDRFGSKWTLALFLVTRIFCRKKPVLIKNQRKTLKSIASHYILHVFFSSREKKKTKFSWREFCAG